MSRAERGGDGLADGAGGTDQENAHGRNRVTLSMPHAHDDRYHQRLHEPVTGMDGGHPPRDVPPEHRSGEEDHREPDPQEEAELYRAHAAADADEDREAREEVGESQPTPNPAPAATTTATWFTCTILTCSF